MDIPLSGHGVDPLGLRVGDLAEREDGEGESGGGVEKKQLILKNHSNYGSNLQKRQDHHSVFHTQYLRLDSRLCRTLHHPRAGAS